MYPLPFFTGFPMKPLRAFQFLKILKKKAHCQDCPRVIIIVRQWRCKPRTWPLPVEFRLHNEQ